MIDGINFFNEKVTATQKVELPRNNEVQMPKENLQPKKSSEQLDVKAMAAAIKEANVESSNTLDNKAQHMLDATEKIVKSGRITPITAKRLVIHKIATGEIDLDKTDKYLDIVKGQNGENIIIGMTKLENGSIAIFSQAGNLKDLAKLKNASASELQVHFQGSAIINKREIFDRVKELYQQQYC